MSRPSKRRKDLVCLPPFGTLPVALSLLGPVTFLLTNDRLTVFSAP